MTFFGFVRLFFCFFVFIVYICLFYCHKLSFCAPPVLSLCIYLSNFSIFLTNCSNFYIFLNINLSEPLILRPPCCARGRPPPCPLVTPLLRGAPNPSAAK